MAKKKTESFEWREKNQELVGLIRARKLEEALDLGQELVDYVDKKYKKDSKEKATSYNNMGMVFMLTRDYGLAETCFREALAMRRRLLGDESDEVAVVFLNLAQLYKVQAEEIMPAQPRGHPTGRIIARQPLHQSLASPSHTIFRVLRRSRRSNNR